MRTRIEPGARAGPGAPFAAHRCFFPLPVRSTRRRSRGWSVTRRLRCDGSRRLVSARRVVGASRRRRRRPRRRLL